jgi:ribosomal protein S18 acetylase RimI-like enzyme
VGFAGSVPAGTDPAARSELWGLSLRTCLHGSGLGQRLLDASVGAEPAALWVAEANPRAQAFYRRNGFAFDGTKEVVEDWEGLVEVRMIR